MTDRVLLPTNVVPVKYALHLTPDLAAFTFAGRVRIDAQVREATRTVVLHALSISIGSAAVDTAAAKGVAAVGVVENKADETVTLTFPDALPKGDCVLAIEYTGELNDKMCGFYRSKYTNAAGADCHMAVTQFEPADARRALPCWDEPSHKAVFDVTLTIPGDRMALSNMPVTSTTAHDNGTQTITFASSPKMSTYLLAFVVGEFEFVESRTKQDVVVRVYTAKGQTEQGRFALDVGVRVLEYFTEYFDIGYPLPKADMIAIPDFSAGAMENWGLITYRETALLIDPVQSPLSSKQRVAYVVAHELAHQWFGNLVTPEWWTHLWLNEGFATWVGNLAVDELFPEWDIWTQFVSQYVYQALDHDAKQTSHAIEVDVKASSEINEIFDAISYSKGASVIRMIADFLGAEPFKNGLRSYLKEHAYGNAVTTDLWKSLSESSGRDVPKFMDDWTRRVGYPYLKVEAVGGDELSLTQSRFYSSRELLKSEDGEAPWWVHLDINTQGVAKTPAVSYDLQGSTGTVAVPGVEGGSWVKLNAGQAGFYRVLYPGNMLTALATAIESGTLPTIDRIGVQNDTFAMARAGLLSTDRFLELARSYRNEESYVVWSDLSLNLTTLRTVWEGEPCFGSFKTLLRELYGGIFKKLGWEGQANEPQLNAMLRPVVLSMLAGADDEGVIAEGKRRFASHVKGDAQIPPNLRAVVYRIAAAHGGDEAMEQLLDLYRNAPMHEEKVRALAALGFVSNTQKALEFSIGPEVRSQDTYVVINSTASRLEGREITWAFMKENWAKIFAMFGEGQFLMARIISLATARFVSTDKAADVEAFFDKNPVANSTRTIKQSLETIRANAAWLEADRGVVAKMLSGM